MAKKSRKERLYNDAKALKIDLGEFGDYEASLGDKNYVAQIHGAFKARAGEQFSSKFPDVESFYKFMSEEPAVAPVEEVKTTEVVKETPKGETKVETTEQVDFSKFLPGVESPVSSTDNLAVDKVPQGKSAVTGDKITPRSPQQGIDLATKEGATKLEKEVGVNIATGKADAFAGNPETELKRKKADDLAGVVYESITKDDKIANFFVLPASGLMTQKERGNLTPKLKNIQSVINEYASKYNLDADEKILLYNGIKNRIETKPAIESAMLNARIATKEITGIDPIAASFLKSKDVVKDTEKINQLFQDTAVKTEAGIKASEEELKGSLIGLRSEVEANLKSQAEQIGEQYKRGEITQMFAEASIKGIQANADATYKQKQEELIKGYTSRVKSQIIANENFVKGEISKLNSKNESPAMASAMGVFNKQFEEQYAAETSKIANEQLMAYKNKYGALGQIGSGIYSGTGNVIRSLGGYLGSIGQLKAEEVLRVAGDQMTTNADLPAMEMNWENAADPTFWYNMGGQTIPYMAAVAGTIAVTKNLGAGGLVGATLASTVATSVLESGGVYEDALARGEGSSVASAKASENFDNNMKLIGLNALMLAPFFGKIKGFGGTLLAEVGSEVPEELWQSYQQQKAVTPDLTLKEFVFSKEGAITAVSAAGLSMGLASGAHIFTNSVKGVQSYMGTRALTKSVQQVGLNNTLASLEINKIAGELSEEDYAKAVKQANEIAESLGALNDITDASKYMAVQLDAKIKELQSKMPKDKESPIYKAKEKQIKALQTELDGYVLGDTEAMSAISEGDDAPYPLTENEVKDLIEQPEVISRLANGTLSINTAGDKKLLKEIDKKIEEYQTKAGEILDPLSDMPASMMSTIQRVEEGTPTDPIALEEASNYLYEKYKYLSAMKKSDKRELTTEQIDTYMNNIGNDIEMLEKAKYPELSQEEITAKVEDNIGEVQATEVVEEIPQQPKVEVEPVSAPVEEISAPPSSAVVGKQNNVREIDIESQRRPNGTIGTQGFTPESIKGLVGFLNNSLGLNIPSELFEGEKIKPLIDFIKSNKDLVSKIEEYVKTDPIEVSELPDGTLHIKDGNHRANLLNLIGAKTLPVVDAISPSETSKSSGIKKIDTEEEKALINIEKGLSDRQSILVVSASGNDASVGNVSKIGVGNDTKIKLTENEKKEVKRQFRLFNDGDLTPLEFNQWRVDFSDKVLGRVKDEINNGSSKSLLDKEQSEPTEYVNFFSHHNTNHGSTNTIAFNKNDGKLYQIENHARGKIIETTIEDAAKELWKTESPRRGMNELEINEAYTKEIKAKYESQIKERIAKISKPTISDTDLESAIGKIDEEIKSVEPKKEEPKVEEKVKSSETPKVPKKVYHVAFDASQVKVQKKAEEKSVEKIPQEKKTVEVNGYKLTDTPEFQEAIITPVNDFTPSLIEEQMFVSDKKKVLADGIEEIRNGWYKVSEGVGGGITLYNINSKELVELDHKKGGRMGILIQDFTDNNPREVKTENKEKISKTAPVQTQETITTKEDGKGNKVEAEGQRRKDVLSTPEVKPPVKREAKASSLKDAEAQLKEEKKILISNINQLGEDLFKIQNSNDPELYKRAKVSNWEQFKKFFGDNPSLPIVYDNSVYEQLTNNDNYTINPNDGIVTMKFPNREGEFSFPLDQIIDVVKALDRLYPTNIPTEAKVKSGLVKTGVQDTGGFALHRIAERLVLEGDYKQYLQDAQYNYDQAVQSGNKALQDVMKKQLEFAKNVDNTAYNMDRDDLLRRRFKAQEEARKAEIVDTNKKEIEKLYKPFTEATNISPDFVRFVELSEKYNIPLSAKNIDDFIAAQFAEDIFASKKSFDIYLLQDVELNRAKQQDTLDSLKTKKGIYNANATKYGSKAYNQRRNAESLYDYYDKKASKLIDNKDKTEKYLGVTKTFLDKTIEAIDAEYKRTKGKAFESILGIPVAIYQGALVTLKTTLQITRSVAQAIQSAVDHINEQMNGADWDEMGFREKFNAILGGKTEPTPPSTPEPPTTTPTPKKKRRGKGMRERGRAKSFRQGRVLQSEPEFNRFIENLRLDYKKKNIQTDFLAPAQELLQRNGFTEAGMEKSSNEILGKLATDPLNNPWAPVAAEILSHEYFRAADEALGENNQEKFEEYAQKAYNLFQVAADAYTKSGQFSSSAMLGRLLPEHVVIFIGKEFQKFGESGRGKKLSKRIKEATAKTKEEIQRAADEAVRSAANEVTEKITGEKIKATDKATTTKTKSALKEKGKALIDSGLAKLKKGGYLGSTGLSEDTIEGIAEFIYGHILVGVANINSIAKKLQRLTNGAIKASDVREVFENETYLHDGKELPFNQINEQVNKDKVAKQFEKAVTTEKITKKISQLLQERKLELRDVIEENLKAGLPEEIVNYLTQEFNLTPSQAEQIAKDAETAYKTALEARINKILEKQLGVKQKASEKSVLAKLEALPLDVKMQTVTIDGVEMPILGNEMLIAKAYSTEGKTGLTTKLDKLFEANKKLLAEEERNKRNHANVIIDQIVAGALDNDTLLEAFSEKYGFPTLTPEMIMEIRRLADIAYSMDIDSARALANAKLLEYVHKHVPPSAESVLRAMYYTSLLTGISTAFANIRGNAAMAFTNAMTSYSQDLIDIKNLPKGTDMETINKSVASSYKNLTQSINGFLDVMAYGGSENKYYKVDKDTFKDFDQEQMVASKDDFTKEVLTDFKGVLKTMAKVYSTAPVIFQRNLTAMDNAFTSFGRNHMTKRLLRNKYRAEGLRGAELWGKVYSDLYGSGDVLVDAQRRAEEAVTKLGYSKESRPKLYKRFVADYVQSTLDEEIQADAKEFALESTFKGPLRGGAGFLARAIPKLAFGNPTLEAIMFPFVNIGGKIAETFTNFIPGYGILRGLGYSFTDTLRNSNSSIDEMFEKAGIKKAQRESPELRKRQLIQASLGTLVWATALALSTMKTKCPDDEKEHPLLEISGGYGGLTYTEKEEVIKNKMPEYSFRFNCSAPIPYKFNPLLAPAFIGLAVSQDAERAGKDEPEFLQYAMAIPSYILSSLPIKNLKEQIDNLSKYLDAEVKKSANSLAIDLIKYIGGIPANIATPNLYKQIFDYIDPTRYTADDAKEAIFRILNMERIGGNKEAYDWRGETIKFYPGERDLPIQYMFGEYGKDEISKYIIDNGISRPRTNKDYVVFDKKRGNVTTPSKFKERYRLDIPAKDIESATQEFQKANELRVLTDKEWYDFDRTVKKNVYAILKDGWKDTQVKQPNYNATLDKPFSKMDKYEFQKYINGLYKLERANYIMKNFYASVDEEIE